MTSSWVLLSCGIRVSRACIQNVLLLKVLRIALQLACYRPHAAVFSLLASKWVLIYVMCLLLFGALLALPGLQVLTAARALQGKSAQVDLKTPLVGAQQTLGHPLAFLS